MFFVWLFFYGVVMILSGHFVALTEWAVPVGLLISTGTLVGYLKAKRQGEFLSFRNISFFDWKFHWFFLPYLLPAVYHLLRFGFLPRSWPDVFSIFFAAVLEEVIFRGILLNLFCRRYRIVGIILSSIVFAAAHFINLENGTDMIYICYQVVYALAIGFALAGISRSCRSLLPCIGIHFFINITASASLIVPGKTDFLFWICIMVCFACGIRSICFLTKINKK